MQSNMHFMLQTFDKYPIEGILPLTFGPRFIECAQQVVRECMGESMDSPHGVAPMHSGGALLQSHSQIMLQKG